jgi:hypothetical protein
MSSLRTGTRRAARGGLDGTGGAHWTEEQTV